MSDLTPTTFNFDLEGFSSVALDVIDKFSELVGWNMTSIGPHREALKLYVESIKERDDLTDAQKAVLIYNARRDLKAYANQIKAVTYGVKQLDGKSNVGNLTEDWLYAFLDGAGTADQEELKMLWGRILESQCEGNNISKRLLQILPQMDFDSAQSFTKLVSTCAFWVFDDTKRLFPLVFGSRKEQGSPITYDDYVELQSLGLIECTFLPFGGYKEMIPDGTIIHYFDESYENLVKDGSINIGSVIFTKAGHELASVIETEKIEGYFETYCLPYIQNPHKEIDDLIGE